MSENSNKDISIIITLYKTPIKNIKLINQYKGYKVLIFHQAKSNNSKNKIDNLLKFDFEYYSSKKNIGLSKSTNFLLSKVKTKYCLFTQPDITINNQAIKKLKKIIELKKDIIFAGPIIQKKKNSNNKISKNIYKIKKKLDASCMLCDVKKTKKIGFFDENFFLYWEDIDLMTRVNKSKYKMVEVLNSFAVHQSSQSSEGSLKISIIRAASFKYGEYLYDYKYKKFRIIKLFRQLIQNLLYMILNLIIFRGKKVLRNFSYVIGIVIFLKFLIVKNDYN